MKLLQGDCLEKLQQIPKESVDLIVTSPPYNVGMDYGEYKDNLGWNDYFGWCEQWLKLCFEVLKKDGRIALNVAVQVGKDGVRLSPASRFMKILEDIGYKFMGMPIWIDDQKPKYTSWGSWMSSSAPYIYNPCQVVIICAKESKKKINKGQNTISKEDFIRGCNGIWKIFPETRTLTNASFPVQLPKLCVELLSFKNDVVLDPFMGSGTTGVACQMTERDFIGIQLNKQYFYIAKNRIEKSRFVQGFLF